MPPDMRIVKTGAILAMGLFCIQSPSFGTESLAAMGVTGAPREEIQIRRAWALERLLANLSVEGTAPGAVVASPSKRDPNYFYHWVRDSGLVMSALIAEMDDVRWSASLRTRIETEVRDWLAFEARLQETPNRSGGLGEPRFLVDGRADHSDWGRPQNDGPALRALAAIRFAWREIALGRRLEVERRLYRAELPARTLIKKDLEFVAHHWRESSVDLWEEVTGDHFFTRMVQRRALLLGAELATALDDPEAAVSYRLEASKIARALEDHLDPARGVLLPTLRQVRANQLVQSRVEKTSGLDVAVVLGVLHGEVPAQSGGFTVQSRAVRRSAELLEADFLRLYPLNAGSSLLPREEMLAPAIGRYPEDVYDGTGSSQGHPWFLATNAYAEWHCRRGEGELGIRYLLRTIHHQGLAGEMSEQYLRTTGFQQGARDLTWSYASFLTATRACLE